ncbi:hypothetical protein B0T17DRAFT_509102 [Bombardia bombarda]|uniref:NAD(P)-binding protein n=1 Tax=Bombardia bombarda TaxID=252184 RepID=A0AA40C1Q2_9PEZI|nr:hypothetical protein B0T17DRAFT_509102 [Bombardia bombarda]
MTTPRRKTVLITGASEGGIGNALALAFHHHGLHVFATARSVSKMSNLSPLPNMTLLPLDVTSSSSIAALVAAIQSHPATTNGTTNTLDILVNNSGLSYVGPALDTPLSTVRNLFDVNYFGLIEVTQAFSKLLVASARTGGGSPVIVNIGSVAAHFTGLYLSTYAASKAAVEMFSEALRLEMAPLGVKVLTMTTALVKSKMSGGSNLPPTVLSEDSFWALPAGARTMTNVADRGMDADRFAEQVVGDVLSGRTGRVWRGP